MPVDYWQSWPDRMTHWKVQVGCGACGDRRTTALCSHESPIWTKRRVKKYGTQLAQNCVKTVVLGLFGTTLALGKKL